jgi:hypothetical protein
VPLPAATGTGGCLDSDAMQYGTVKLDTASDGIGQAARPGGHGDSGSVALATPPGPPQASWSNSGLRLPAGPARGPGLRVLRLSAGAAAASFPVAAAARRLGTASTGSLRAAGLESSRLLQPAPRDSGSESGGVRVSISSCQLPVMSRSLGRHGACSLSASGRSGRLELGPPGLCARAACGSRGHGASGLRAVSLA